MDLKKQIKLIDLVVAAGQKRVSPRTGFVHLFPNEEVNDTIPIYENFCFAFALFRQKTAESVERGKELIRKLLFFQTAEGHFPLYLHDFPNCFDASFPLKIAPILIYLLRYFSPVLGELKQRIETALQAILARPLVHSMANRGLENRLRACRQEPLLPVDPSQFSNEEWTDWIITSQLAGQTHFSLCFDAALQLFRSKACSDVQEKQEPRPHPIEWLLSEGQFSSRLLKDHPHLLLCAPLFPITYTFVPLEDSSFRLFWKGEEMLHSLFGKSKVFDLCEPMEPSRSDLFEAVLYCNLSSENRLLVDGKKATFFKLGQTITIESFKKVIHLQFHLTQGSGDFSGHIFPANRPSQIKKKEGAFDWQIGIRTLRRSPSAQIQVSYEIEPE